MTKGELTALPGEDVFTPVRATVDSKYASSEYWPIEKLSLWDKNPRAIKDDRFKELKARLSRQGQIKPLLVTKDGTVIGGNMRLRAFQELGWREVWVSVTEAVTDKEIFDLALTDNEEFGYYEQEQLAELALSIGLSPLELKTYEVSLGETTTLDLVVDKFGPEDVEEDEVPEVDETGEPESRVGEVYQLGRHRLMCGDSTDADAVSELMDGKKADMVFTDPPYGMKKENEGVLNDNLNYDDLLEFNKQWIPLSFDFMKDNGSWYCWGIDEPLMDIYSQILKPMARSQRVTFRNLITWFKNPSGLGDGQNNPDARSYGIITEKCLFVMGGVQGFNNNSDNYYEGWEPLRLYLNSEMEKVGGSKNWREALGNQMGGHYFTTSQWSFPTLEAYTNLQNYAGGTAFTRPYEDLRREYTQVKREFDRIRAEWQDTRAFFDNTHSLMTEVWQFNRTTQEEREGVGGHATPKPLDLCARAIKSSSRKDEVVLDLFLGSGSTLIACEQTDRTCYGMELDPKYVDVIRKRYANHIGEGDNWQEVTPAVKELVNA